MSILLTNRMVSQTYKTLEPRRPAYLDCNATTPVDPGVARVVRHFLEEEFGNAGSRTHEYGATAKRAVNRAREQVAAVVNTDPNEVVFTSGATESNNLAILGLADWAAREGRRHLVSTAIEHKAVLEPLEELVRRGFECTLLRPGPTGRVTAEAIARAVRPDTSIVSVMHMNNETGVIQPIEEIADRLAHHQCFLHVDAAQGFGKDLAPLRHQRVDLISISGHKIFGPKGVGALIARKRGFDRPPLAPLMFGGGQERRLRPGTISVPLVAGLGEASELALSRHKERHSACREYRRALVAALEGVPHEVNGDPEHTLVNTLNVSITGLDSEAAMVALKGLAAVSNGSACTSHSYSPSHVLEAMDLPGNRIANALRFSWCHETPQLDWGEFVRVLRSCAIGPKAG